MQIIARMVETRPKVKASVSLVETEIRVLLIICVRRLIAGDKRI
jgi:hypothetical protein